MNPITDATSLGLSHDERESIIGQLASTPEAKAAFRTKSDVYLKTRLEIAAEMGTVSKSTPMIEIRVSGAAALRNDAAVAEAAYRKNVAGLNSWREDRVERGEDAPERGKAHAKVEVEEPEGAPAPALVTEAGLNEQRLRAEAAYQKAVNGLNDWRNQ